MRAALHNVWADLVEKRLWPLAVVLALALVAVPVVLAKMGGSAPAPAPLPPAPASAAAPAPTAVAASKPIQVVDPTATKAPRGRYHNPFGGQSQAPASTTSSGSSTSSSGAGSSSSSASASSASSASSGSSSASPSGSSSSGSSTASSGKTTSSGTTRPARSPQVSTPSGYAAGYRMDLGFGAAGQVKDSRDAVRLAPLGPKGKTPVVLFVGVLGDGRTALFLRVAWATPTGDAKCWPTKVTCQLLEMKAGDSEFFDVPDGGTSVVQYELDVNHIAKRYAATAIGAYNDRRRESKAGRKAMYQVVKLGRTYVTRLMYSRNRGVLFLPHRSAKTGGPSA